MREGVGEGWGGEERRDGGEGREWFPNSSLSKASKLPAGTTYSLLVVPFIALLTTAKPPWVNRKGVFPIGENLGVGVGGGWWKESE